MDVENSGGGSNLRRNWKIDKIGGRNLWMAPLFNALYIWKLNRINISLTEREAGPREGI